MGQAPTGFFCELDTAGLPCAAVSFSSLRFRMRRASFCLRMRLNLDLSPLARDIKNSCRSVSHNHKSAGTTRVARATNHDCQEPASSHRSRSCPNTHCFAWENSFLPNDASRSLNREGAKRTCSSRLSTSKYTLFVLVPLRLRKPCRDDSRPMRRLAI